MKARDVFFLVIAASAAACSLDAKGNRFGLGDVVLLGAGPGGAGGAPNPTGGSAGAGGVASNPAGGGVGGEGGSPLTGAFGGGFATRAPIRVQAGYSTVPSGYSVKLVFDHAALVTSDESLPSGDDVRVACDEGGKLVERHRVINPGSAWNQKDTTLWFRSPAPIFANAADTSCWLYYGAGAAESADPPADGSKVHVFFDDFESGSLTSWNAYGGSEIAVVSDKAYRGTHSMKGSSVTGGSDRWISAVGVYEDNLAMESYWMVSAISGMDIAQGVRAAESSTLSLYETNLEGGDNGWDIAKIVNKQWNEIVGQPGGQNPQVNTWTRITTRIFGTKMQVLRDDLPLVPSSGVTEVGSEITAGSAALRLHRIPSNQAWWVDDVIVRKYVDPEPTATLGAAEKAP